MSYLLLEVEINLSHLFLTKLIFQKNRINSLYYTYVRTPPLTHIIICSLYTTLTLTYTAYTTHTHYTHHTTPKLFFCVLLFFFFLPALYVLSVYLSTHFIYCLMAWPLTIVNVEAAPQLNSHDFKFFFLSGRLMSLGKK